MRARTASTLAWGACAAALVIGCIGLALSIAVRSTAAEDFAYFSVFLAMATVGALILSRQPGNVIGILFLFIVAMVVSAFVTGAYAAYALDRAPGLPGVSWAAWFSSWAWVVAIGPMVTLLPLLFPNGVAVSRRWRWIGAASAISILACAAAVSLIPGRLEGTTIANPIGVTGAGPVLAAVAGVSFALLLVLSAASIASLFLRYRRTRGDERQQIKWFVYSMAVVGIWLVVTSIPEFTGWRLDRTVDAIGGVVTFGTIPLAAGVAILKYRLYDIDVVIRKSVVFAALAAFMTGVYALIVVGIGAAVAGTTSSAFLTMVAAVVIAVTFQPVRARVTRFANRLIYGARATPYEVMSEFSARMGDAYVGEDLLPRMARILAEGTGAEHADVWLQISNEIRVAASWPPGAEGRALAMSNGRLPSIPEADAAYAVRHGREILGALSVRKSRDDPISPAEDKLVTDLAAQAGLVLRNVRLTTELRANLDELRASRQRIVAAQDAERRRLERNIHDGAQQQLVALAVKVRLARGLARRDAERAEEVLGQLEADASGALETLRDLARGIYPPLLADGGLVAALRSQAAKVAVPVAVEAEDVRRYPQEIEAAVYFCCLEALQNVAKYANASRVQIRVREDAGALAFEVIDDGSGFDTAAARDGTGLQGMADRLAALDGSLEVRSSQGRGTTVAGTIPLRANAARAGKLPAGPKEVDQQRHREDAADDPERDGDPARHAS